MIIAVDQRRLAAAFFLAFGLIAPSARAEVSEIRLEGILWESEAPESSIAVIDGAFVKKGQTVQGYRVLEVLPRAVKVVKVDTGAETLVELQEAAPKAAEAAGPAPAEAEPAPQDWNAKLKAFWELPGRAMNRLWELRALRDLAILNNAAVGYYNKRSAFPRKLTDLIESGFVPASYESGVRGRYRFYFVSPPKPEDFSIHADPLDQEAGLRFFRVGTDAIIREAYGRPASGTSDPHEYN